MIPYAVPLLISTSLSAALALLAWRRRHVRGAMAFAVLMLGVTEWTLGYVLELESAGLSWKLFWAKSQYLGIVSVPAAWLVFALEYTGRERWLKRRSLLLLSVLPVVSLILAWTNPAHHLMIRSVYLVGGPAGSMLGLKRGPAFWLHTGYSYVLLVIGAVFLCQAHLRSGRAHRGQTRTLLAAVLIPWVANAVYLAGVHPFGNLDLTAFAFTISGTMMFRALFRHRFLKLVPVARNMVIKNMRDGVLVVDSEDRVADLNPAAERICRASKRDAVGEPVREVLAAWTDLVDQFGQATEARGEITVGDDDQRVYELTVAPLHGDRGRFLGRVIAMRDITERKRVEQALHQRAIELQARNDELYAFARTVAHELKEPLTSVVGYAEVLEHYYAPMLADEVRSYLRTISRKGRKMGSIIEELLLLSAVRREQDVELSELDMGEIVAEALGRVEDLAEECGAEISAPDSWPVALGYASWVEEVWVNYLSNAIKYGGRPPRVELGANRESDGFIRFWVRDNGPGLTAEEQAQLFTPFSKLGRMYAAGHGLGLSIVQRIMTKLGGRVGVESKVGEGSVFSFALGPDGGTGSAKNQSRHDEDGGQDHGR